MKDRFPVVSIIIPVYNRKKLVVEAVESALEQTYPNVEVVVVDDASNDGTEQILKTFHSSISLIRQPQNTGQSAARNKGIAACRGEYVLFLDSDDTLESDAIQTLWSILKSLEEKNSTWGVIYGKRLTCDAEMNPVKTRARKYHSGSILSHLLLDNIVRTGTCLIRKTILEEMGGFKEDLVVKEDLLLYLSIAARYNFFFVDKYISKYRRHSGPRARDNHEKILEQGTRHLDYFFAGNLRLPFEAEILKRRVYANEHISLARTAWRLDLPNLYLTHWKAAYSYQKRFFFHPKHFFRAMLCLTKQ